MGTSPRMRGKRGFRHQLGCCVRNIPAYAGKTVAPLFCIYRGEEHPRVCGENVKDWLGCAQS